VLGQGSGRDTFTVCQFDFSSKMLLCNVREKSCLGIYRDAIQRTFSRIVDCQNLCSRELFPESIFDSVLRM
jgi:hypothetical protein